MSGESNLSQDQKVLLALRNMRAKLDKLEAARHEPIAVIGMGCRFPGGARGPEDLWGLLREGINVVSDAPKGRWAADPLADVDEGQRPFRGAFLEDVDRFDFQFFGLSPREASALDPQHRLVLQVAWEALEDAGTPADSLAGSPTAVFIGISTGDYGTVKLRNPDGFDYDMYDLTGNALSCAAGRLSFMLDLQGPAASLDTACSSALAAVHLACQSLRSGDSDLALAGGVNVIASPLSFIVTSRGNMISPDGTCKTFDAGADGYGRGEGCGVVVLKRLSDALASGDPIHAVIRGSAMVHDGRSSGLTVPNGLAQIKLIRRALADAGVKPGDVTYVEAHGTGTALGDPIEVESLRVALGEQRPKEQPLWVGSVKTNFGHLEAAAGVAGLMKAILAVKHGEIPAHLNLKQLNPRLPLAEIPAIIPLERTPWPADRPRIAGVSSFGFSGTNVHLIVGEPPRADAEQAAAGAGEDAGQLHLVPLSARSPQALVDMARACAARFEGDGDAGAPQPRLVDVGYTSARRRAHHAHRLAIVAPSRSAWAFALKAYAEGRSDAGAITGVARPDRTNSVVFVYPGQGSQWVGMGRELLAREPAFRQEFERAAQAIAPFVSFRLMDELYDDGGVLARGDIDVVQPALFAMELALTALWRSWGIEPDAVVGHSKGEVAACCVAGALSIEDAARVICVRSRLLRRVSGKGAIVIVGLSAEEARRYLAAYEGRIWIAASNSPSSTALGGQIEALDELVATLRGKQIYCQPVKTDVASHTPMMAPLQDDILRELSCIQPAPPRIPIYSTVTAEATEVARFDARYWVDNLRRPVLFLSAIERLLKDDFNVFMEMSPHPILLHSVREALEHRKTEGFTIPSGRRGIGERQALLESLGRAYGIGLPVAWERLYPARTGEADGGRLVRMPPYPWHEERLWLSADGSKRRPGSALGLRRALGSGEPGRPLLHRRLPLSRPGLHAWETQIDADRLPYLQDHRVQGTVVFPATAYLHMAHAAAEEVFGPGEHGVEDVAFRSALFIPEGEERTVQIVVSSEMSGMASFEIATLTAPAEDGKPPSWTVNVTGTIVAGAVRAAEAPVIPLAEVRGRCGQAVPKDAIYAALEERGLSYGPSFQGVEEAWRGEREILARLRLTDAVASDNGYPVHPALLDAATHASVLASMGEPLEAGDVFLPVAAGRQRVLGPCRQAAWSYLRMRAPLDGAGQESEMDILLLDEEGRALVQLTGMRSRRLSRSAASSREGDLEGWFFETRWRRQPAPEAPAQRGAGGWLLFGNGDGTDAELRVLLERSGAVCRTVVPGGEFRVEGGGKYRVNPTSLDDHRKLLQAVFAGDDVPWRGVVHLWSLRAEAPEGAGVTSLERAWDLGAISALYLARALVEAGRSEPPRLWLLTRGAQPVSPDQAVSVVQAPMLGLGRVIANEQPALRCTCVDLDPATPSGEAEALARELLSDDREDEIALRGAERHVARLVPCQPEASASTRTSVARTSRDGFRLEIPTPGILDALTLVEVPREEPGAGEVEIQVDAAGMNFSDVMKVMGIYPNPPGGKHILGGECAGRVSRVGPGVERFKEGDEVMAAVPYAFASFVTVPASVVLHKPANLSAEQAAAIPVVFLTAHYAMNTLGRLARGERVLIHAASGGVGLAAMQLARRAGATIFATAGTEEKRAFVRSLGYTEHVMDSRSLEFAEQILELTGGAGVDVILNSLTGAGIAKGMAILAQGGRFLDISKRDIYENSRLGMLPFQKNLSYFAVDLQPLGFQKPELMTSLLRELLPELQDGRLKPLPTREFPISRAIDAFRLMAQAKHTGKIVLSVREPEVRVARSAGAPLFSPDAHYLITGGLGDIGLKVARWMVDAGARHLTLMGRRAPSEPAREVVREMERAGAQIHVVQADVSRAADVARVCEGIAASPAPLRGVIHAAAVIDDAVLLNLDRERFARVMAPKVLGTWALHHATSSTPLDFFVMFSTGSSVLGAAGQGNYAAASAFLDAFAHYRRALGLPAQTINWGPWAEVGLAARGVFGERAGGRGLAMMSPAQGLAALDRLLRSQVAQAMVMPRQAPQWYQVMPSAPARSLLRDLLADAGGAADAGTKGALRKALLGVPPGPQRRAMLENHICEQSAQVLRLDLSRIGPQTLFGGLGFDSLMSLELRNRLEVSLGLTLPATLIWSHSHAAALASHLAERMDIPLGEGAGAAAAQAQEDAALDEGAIALLTQFGALSEGSLQELLATGSSNEGAIE